MKTWPDNEKPAKFDDIFEPFLMAVKHCYKLKVKPITTIPYDGLEQGVLTAASCPSVEDLNDPEYVEKRLSNGETPLDLILGNLIRVSMEQGRRARLHHVPVGDMWTKLLASVISKTGLSDVDAELEMVDWILYKLKQQSK